MKAHVAANCGTFGSKTEGWNHPEITAGCNRSLLQPVVSPDRPRRFLITFRGENNINVEQIGPNVRPLLRKAFGNMKRDDVLVQVKELGKPLPAIPETDITYEELLVNSTYVLVPRGHGRWSYRMSETVGACSIPVILSDGMTMPFEELIDWKKAAIRLPEKIAHAGADTILAALPKDPAVIHAMRQEVCKINEKYFASMGTRVDAMLRACVVKSQHLAHNASRNYF
jgi:hypothetical protein